MTIAQNFAEFAAEFQKRPAPAGIIHHAKRAVVDWHAALLPGAVAAPAILLEKALRDELDRGRSVPVIGTAKATALLGQLWQLDSRAGTRLYEDFAPGRPSR